MYSQRWLKGCFDTLRLAADVGIHNKKLGFEVSGDTSSGAATLTVLNEDLKDIVKIHREKSLEDLDLLIKCITQTIEKEKERVHFLIYY